MDELDGVQRQRIGIIAMQCGHIGLNGVCHGVHAGMGRQLRGHLLGQVRVHNGDIRCDVEVRQRILDTLRIVGNNSESGDLGGSAGRGRNGAELRLRAQRREAERGDQVLKGDLGIFIKRPHGLRSIDGRTTAHGNDPVRLKLTHGRRTAHHSLNRGVRLHVFKQAHFHAGLLQVALYLVQKAEALHAAAANNDDGLFAFQVGQLRDRALAMIQITR